MVLGCEIGSSGHEVVRRQLLPASRLNKAVESVRGGVQYWADVGILGCSKLYRRTRLQGWTSRCTAV